MAKLARDCAGAIKIKKMSPPENRFKIASEEIQNEQICQQMPRTDVQQRRGDKLPGISIAHTLIGNAKIRANESRLPPFNKELRHKKCHIRAEQYQ